MRCINKIKITSLALILSLSFTGYGRVAIAENEKVLVLDYESTFSTEEFGTGNLFASELAVAEDDISNPGYTPVDGNCNATGLFDVSNENVLYADSIHEQLYPASTTKILTAYIALKYGNLDDVVTVSEVAVSVPSDSSTINLRIGDQLTLRDLVNGLMLMSGNDAAVAIAEHISGNVNDFVALMNEEAYKLGATNSNFMNPHGYHDNEHYTSAYDLYLIFNECIKNPAFLEILAQDSYSTIVTHSDAIEESVTWMATLRYKKGTAAVPENVQVIGGKTGYTSLAGTCLVLLTNDTEGNPYISVILGAIAPEVLYEEMTPLVECMNSTES